MKNDELLMKAWEVYQEQIKGFGDNCWKIRSVAVTWASALIAFGFTAQVHELYLGVPPVMVMFMILEAGYRRFQMQCIVKSREIERSLNDILAGEAHPRLPDDGISTSLQLPTLGSLFMMFAPKRFLFWVSYLLLSGISLVLFFFKITK